MKPSQERLAFLSSMVRAGNARVAELLTDGRVADAVRRLLAAGLVADAMVARRIFA